MRLFEGGTYHVETIPRCVASDNIDFFVGVEPDHVLLEGLS